MNGVSEKAAPNRSEYDQVDVAATTPVATTDDAVVSAVALVEVVAPATLSEGYTFQAEVNGRTFDVVVPQGGVAAGQKFSVPLPDSSPQSVLDDVGVPRNSIPVGHWRDGIFDCFRFGPCHTLVFMGWFCPSITMAQVMTRMELNWAGDRTSAAQAATTFKKVLFVTLCYFIITSVILPLCITVSLGDISQYEDREFPDGYVQVGKPLPTSYIVFAEISNWIHLVFLVYVVVAMTKTRAHIRDKYGIPETTCMGCEDCVCACFCSCCTVSQMARHTADYDTYTATCCTENGLPDHVESIV